MSDEKKALLIVNPCSGRYPIGHKSYNYGENFWRAGYATDVRMTTGRGDATAIAKSCAGDYDIIVCRGGDGTLSEVINGLMQSGTRTPVGYIPSGTTNDFAKSNRIPLDDEKAIELIVEGDPTAQDIGSFNNSLYFAYTASFGLFTRSSYATKQKFKNRFGYAAYLVNGAREAADIKSFRAKITCDGRDCSGEYVFGSITNSLSVGGIMRYDENIINFNDGVLEMLLAKKPKNFAALVELVSSVRRQKIDTRYLTFAQGKDIQIEFENDSVPWSIDGEFGGSHRSIHIECCKGAINIFRGR